MNLGLDKSSRRISFAIGISVLVHALALWGPNIRLPALKSPLPPLVAKLEALPTAATKSKRKPRAAAAPKVAPETAPRAAETQQPPQEAAQPASAPVAASAPAETETVAPALAQEVERPPLPERAELTFGINRGIGGLRIGKAVHTLEIDDGHYVLHAVTQTVGLARLFKSYQLTQYSSGSYGKYGLQPEQFFEERKDKLTTLRYTAEFDHAARIARFSIDREVELPPDTQDILSIMYQFPPLAGAEVVTVSVSNGRKIEQYDFEITANEEIDTPIGTLQTVRLHKLHAPEEEGLDIWLAQEYRLFPVKIRFTEKNGEVSGEAVITDIRVSEEEGERKDAVD